MIAKNLVIRKVKNLAELSSNLNFWRIYRSLEANLRVSQKTFLRVLQHPDAFIYLAEIEGKTVGFISGQHLLGLPASFVGYLIVRTQYRNRGIAKSIFKKVQADLRRRKVFKETPFFGLWVEASSANSEKIFENFGFESIKANYQQPALRKGLESVPMKLMAKQLGSRQPKVTRKELSQFVAALYAQKYAYSYKVSEIELKKLLKELTL